MLAALQRPQAQGSQPCERCGLAIDARHFDESGVVDLPAPGREALLARVELAPQYCGVLEFFSQYTDAQARDAATIETPGLQWIILVNRQVLAPYVGLERIVNPWGFGSFQIMSRLPDGATLEFVVRRRLGGDALAGVTRVGGRLAGRSWYDTSYGNVLAPARNRNAMPGRPGHAP
jgi:hypothetical protein